MDPEAGGSAAAVGAGASDAGGDVADASGGVVDSDGSATDASGRIAGPPASTALNGGIANALSSGVSEDRLDPEPLGTRDQRDRAFTYMDDLVTEVRAAGRYVFRKEPDIAKRFASRHKRRKRAESKSDEAQTEVVEEAVIGEVDAA